MFATGAKITSDFTFTRTVRAFFRFALGRFFTLDRLAFIAVIGQGASATTAPGAEVFESGLASDVNDHDAVVEVDRYPYVLLDAR